MAWGWLELLLGLDMPCGCVGVKMSAGLLPSLSVTCSYITGVGWRVSWVFLLALSREKDSCKIAFTGTGIIKVG